MNLYFMYNTAFDNANHTQTENLTEKVQPYYPCLLLCFIKTGWHGWHPTIGWRYKCILKSYFMSQIRHVQPFCQSNLRFLTQYIVFPEFLYVITF